MKMARLPQPGSDNGTWGNVLNDFLLESHESDGSLKSGAVTATTIQNDSVSEAQLSGAVRSKLNNVVTQTDAALMEKFRPLQGITSAITTTIAAGESKAATFIEWHNAADKYRYCGVEPEAVSGDPSLCINNNNTVAQLFVLQPIVLEFWSNATDVRLHGYNIGRGDYWALVDDMRIMPGWLHANFADNYYTWTLTQGSATWRKWRICVTGAFSGISLNAGATIAPTTHNYRIAVVGDSLVQGGVSTQNAVAPGTSGFITAGTAFGEFEQFTGLDVWRLAIYGTGYVAQSDFGANGPFGSSQRVSKLASLPAMDEVIVFGSVNDGPHASPAIISAANAAWSAIKVAQPTAKLTVVGMECFGYVNNDLDTKNAALKSAAGSHADVARFIDLRADSFITGTGHEGAPQGDGNQDAFISADTTHPTHVGSRYWGENLVRLLGRR